MKVALELLLVWLGFASVIGVPTWINLKVRERRDRWQATMRRHVLAHDQAGQCGHASHPHQISDGIF